MVENINKALNRKYYKKEKAKKYYQKNKEVINQRSKDRWANMSPDERAEYYEKRKQRRRQNND